MKTIKLTELELNYLRSLSETPEIIRKELVALGAKNPPYTVTLTDCEADDLRETCADQLPIEGFDKNYEPNEKGRILESLIDKLFTG